MSALRLPRETMLEGLVMLCPWWRIDRHMFTPIDLPLPWFSWGYLSGGRDRRWYILVKLPSYAMQESDYGFEMCWHQLYLRFVAPLAGELSGIDGWRFEWVPV